MPTTRSGVPASHRLPAELRARGYRLTPQRQLILEAIEQQGHASPDDILDDVRERAGGINISTVYRTLELLEGLGLVTHTHLGHGAPTYHVVGAVEHAHLLCRGCGLVVELDEDEVAGFTGGLDQRYGFDVDIAHLTVEGTCRDCRNQDCRTAAARG